MVNKLIIVADAKRARLCLAVGLKVKEVLCELGADDSSHKTRELGQDHVSKASTQNHSHDLHPDVKDLNRNDFCHTVIEKSNEYLSTNDYKELIIVAAPKMLGDIRKNLNKEYEKMVAKEISKDLTHCSLDELSEHIFSA